MIDTASYMEYLEQQTTEEKPHVSKWFNVGAIAAIVVIVMIVL